MLDQKESDDLEASAACTLFTYSEAVITVYSSRLPMSVACHHLLAVTARVTARVFYACIPVSGFTL